MSTSIFKSVHPIGDTDPRALPVQDVAAAATFYTTHLGFAVTGETETPVRSRTLRRDDVELVLAENGGDPEQASVYIETSDVDAARAELEPQGLDISPLRTDIHGGNTYRVFFVRAPDSLCYCIGQKQAQ